MIDPKCKQYLYPPAEIKPSCSPGCYESKRKGVSMLPLPAAAVLAQKRAERHATAKSQIAIRVWVAHDEFMSRGVQGPASQRRSFAIAHELSPAWLHAGVLSSFRRLPMARNNEPLSAAQIHSVYASDVVPTNKTADAEAVRYSKTSAYKRESAPAGRSPARPEWSTIKKRY